MPNEIDKRVAVNEAAKALRDQADRDYVCARHVYVLGFADQFMWLAQQTLEKYFKATILFGSALPQEGGSKIRRLDAKKRGYGHRLPELLDDVLQLEPWRPQLPTMVGEYVNHVFQMGLNRYSDQHVYRLGDELPRLDESVWYVRRWCQSFTRVPHDTAPASMTTSHWVELQREAILRNRPGSFQLIGGLLESIIKGRRGGMWGAARTNLLRWNRWFYAKRRSGKVPPRWSSSSVPVWGRSWAQHPDIRALLAELGLGPML